MDEEVEEEMEEKMRDEEEMQDSLMVEERKIVKFPLATCLLPLQI